MGKRKVGKSYRIRAGLQLPPSRVRKYLKANVGRSIRLYQKYTEHQMTALLENALLVLLEDASNNTAPKHAITPQDIHRILTNPDYPLARLLPAGGIVGIN